ncbi:MAG: hypothetical protein WCQ21_17425 [Verrucomicrobiota bacterium]
MKTTLICPGDATEVPALARKHPLVLAPFLGRTVLEHALTALAESGAKHVRILASDRPEEIRSRVGRGEAWGITVEVVPSAEGACQARSEAATTEPVITLDHLASLPHQPLWRSYRDWYAAQQALLPAFARQRVGMREVTPGVFVGLRSQIASDATLCGPCWIGEGVCIGSRAVIGAGAIIEDGSYVDDGAEIVGSIVGPQTYVGRYTELRNSFAWGKDLLHLDTGSLAEVNDRFLLSEVRIKRSLASGLANVLRGGRARKSTAPPAANPTGLSQTGMRLKPRPGN